MCGAVHSDCAVPRATGSITGIFAKCNARVRPHLHHLGNNLGSHEYEQGVRRMSPEVLSRFQPTPRRMLALCGKPCRTRGRNKKLRIFSRLRLRLTLNVGCNLARFKTDARSHCRRCPQKNRLSLDTNCACVCLYSDTERTVCSRCLGVRTTGSTPPRVRQQAIPSTRNTEKTREGKSLVV